MIYTPRAGEPVWDAAKRMCAIAALLDERVTGEFNGTPIEARPGEEEVVILHRWQKIRDEHQRRVEVLKEIPSLSELYNKFWRSDAHADALSTLERDRDAGLLAVFAAGVKAGKMDAPLAHLQAKHER